MIFFEELNNKDSYPMSNLKIDEILKHDTNYIKTHSKDNAPILKNNQSTIINLQNSDSYWVSYKKWVIEYFILIHMVLVL